MTTLLIACIAVVLIALLIWRNQGMAGKRMQRLEEYKFPPGIVRKLKAAYPHLTDAQVAMVMQGLREFFAVALMARGRMVSMPSRAVDTAWHEFILFTRGYQVFCRDVLGKFFHHTPAEAMRTPTVAQQGIKRTWRLSCRREHIDPRTPRRLPLLFAIDAMLSIPDGYKYSLDCQPGSSGIYCASHIDCSGGCSGSSDGVAGDSGDSDSSGSDGDGGGCGGD